MEGVFYETLFLSKVFSCGLSKPRLGLRQISFLTSLTSQSRKTSLRELLRDINELLKLLEYVVYLSYTFSSKHVVKDSHHQNRTSELIFKYRFTLHYR